MSSGRSRGGGAGRSGSRSGGRTGRSGTGPPSPRPPAACCWRRRSGRRPSGSRSRRPARRSPDCKTRRSFACIEGETSPTSSRKSVPPSASSNRPFLRRSAPVNEPALVAEKLALQQRVVQGRAVQGEERALAAVVGGVHRLGDELLAGAGLAVDQDRRAERAELLDRGRRFSASSGSSTPCCGSCSPARICLRSCSSSSIKPSAFEDAAGRRKRRRSGS